MYSDIYIKYMHSDIYISESLCCTPETNTALGINYTLIQKNPKMKTVNNFMSHQCLLGRNGQNQKCFLVLIFSSKQDK